MYHVSQSRKASRFSRIALVAGLTVAAVAGAGMNQAAHAQESIFGFTTNANVANGNLFRFASNAPGAITNLGALSGVSGILLDIDFRPANTLLYGLSSNAGTFNLYTIDVNTAAATFVTSLNGTGVTAATGVTYDIDFNPSANALRIVGANGDNFRVPGAQIGTGLGATTVDTALTGGTSIVGVAYTNNFAGAGTTTLYDISSTGQLYTQGGLNGTPSPNLGALAPVGAGTGVTAAEMGFDISGVTGNAYLAANNTFYTVNLGAGTVSTGTAISTTGLTGTVRGISAATAPEPGTLALLATGFASMGGIAVRRRAKKA